MSGRVVPFHPRRLPSDAPVQPLGRLDARFLFVDALGQPLAFGRSALNRLNIIGLFGGETYLSRVFPPGKRERGCFSVRGARAALLASGAHDLCTDQLWGLARELRKRASAFEKLAMLAAERSRAAS